MTARPWTAIADGLLEATVVGSFSRLGFAARRALFDWDAQPVPDLSGRVVLVTGATSGIGLAAARQLAARHANVWIAGRDEVRADTARRRIIEATRGAQVRTVIADLTVLDDVRACAETILREESRLDVVVHNAGVLASHLERTPDGIEVTAQVHVVAPFLLTTLLLERLRATAGSRVITVSSGGMYTQSLDLALLETPPTPFNGTRAYANAKRAQVVLNHSWASRPEAGAVRFHAMHPGWADTPGIQAALPRFRSVMRPLLRTPAQGADTVVWLAGAREALETNGEFWLDRRRRSTEPLPWTRTADGKVGELWDWCERHTRAGVGDLR